SGGANLDAAHRLQKSLQSIGGSAAGCITGDDSNIAVPQAQQVSSGVVCREYVVDADPTHGRIAKARIPVRIDDGYSSQNGFRSSGQRVHGRHSHDAIDTTAME